MLTAESGSVSQHRQYISDAERYRAIRDACPPTLIGRVLERLGTALIAWGRRLCKRGGMEVKVTFTPTAGNRPHRPRAA
jgi:hypothetical protein